MSKPSGPFLVTKLTSFLVTRVFCHNVFIISRWHGSCGDRRSFFHYRLCLYLEPVSGASVYNIYSAGDGAVLQHDVGQMTRPASKLDDVISVTNSHVRSQVVLLKLKSYIFSIIGSSLHYRGVGWLPITMPRVKWMCSCIIYLSNVHSWYDRTMAVLTASSLQLGISIYVCL